MDVSSIASLATQMSAQNNAVAMQVAVLKLAMNAEAQGAAQLVQMAAESMAATNNPPNLGNSVDVFA
ncbi:MAG: putative motility protein [Rhodocyclaceae bacterium]|nr:putative motility protein [Rhodocyclaceae bacterium]